MPETSAVTRDVQIAGRPFRIRSEDVTRTVRSLDPEPIASHYVVVEGRRFPPKQVIGEITGLDRADFTSHQARRTLMRLGFPVGRRTPPDAGGHGSAAARADGLGDRLRALPGRWVAIKNDDVLYDADTPEELVGWLSRYGQRADSMFRVPEDQLAASGLAPL